MRHCMTFKFARSHNSKENNVQQKMSTDITLFCIGFLLIFESKSLSEPRQLIQGSVSEAACIQVWKILLETYEEVGPVLFVGRGPESF